MIRLSDRLRDRSELDSQPAPDPHFAGWWHGLWRCGQMHRQSIKHDCHDPTGQEARGVCAEV